MNYGQAHIDRRRATIHLQHNVDQKTGPSAATEACSTPSWKNGLVGISESSKSRFRFSSSDSEKPSVEICVSEKHTVSKDAFNVDSSGSISVCQRFKGCLILCGWNVLGYAAFIAVVCHNTEQEKNPEHGWT